MEDRNDNQADNRQWWVQRWLELLDSYRFKKRLERARIYAREGNVLSIDFFDSQVLAKVQGSEAKPYKVSLSLPLFTDEDWGYAIETMSQKAIFSAQLLAGEMPENIEDVFIANGLNLFPYTLSDINAHCTCPDQANPCKHIGAVYYQLGDRFSEDPFVLFELRGRTKEEILNCLRQIRSQKKQENLAPIFSSEKTNFLPKPAKKKSEKKSLNLEAFWQYDESLESSLVVISSPPEMKTVLDILGTIPLPFTDAQAVTQYLKQVYQVASQQAIITALNQDQ
jgi:uncharacterized Zn finger protein